MCGRYILNADSRSIAARFAVERVEEYEFFPNRNVAPTTQMPVVFMDEENDRVLARMGWGLIPQWALGKKMPAPFNARSETVAAKPMFRQSLKRRRCLVPMNGFYEWTAVEGGKKQPIQITQADTELFCSAGLWESAIDADGVQHRSFTIVTVAADTQMQPVHDRMPLFLPADAEGVWLDPMTEPDAISDLLVHPDPVVLDMTPADPLAR